MKIYLLENQIELILTSLQNYSTLDKEKLQLIYVTYESLLEQMKSSNQVISTKIERNKNVTQM